jgi:hypothetical protein
VLLLAPWPLLIAVQLGSFVVFGWFAVRLGLAIPAVIVDNLTPVDAIKLAWRVTAPARVWLPVFGAGVLLGLLVIPISFGTVVLDFPAMFGQVTPFAAVSLVVGIGLAPIGASFAYSAYRRLVPPFWPPWTRMPVAIVGGDGTLTFPPPAFVVPPYGPAAKTIVALLVALAIAGLALVAYGVTQFLSGHVVIPLPPMFPYSPGQQGFPPLFTFPPFPSFGP